MKPVFLSAKWKLIEPQTYVHAEDVQNVVVVAINPLSKEVATISISPREIVNFEAKIKDKPKNWDLGIEKLEYKIIAPMAVKTQIEAAQQTLRLNSKIRFYAESDKVELYVLRSGEVRLSVAEDSAARVSKMKAPPKDSKKIVKVLIVDDSPTVRKILRNMIESDPNLEVVAETGQPEKVMDLIYEHDPDVITMDIQMPIMNGVELLRHIYAKKFVPAVVVSALSMQAGSLVIQALEAGAFDYVQKPSMKEIPLVGPILREKLHLAFQVKANHHLLVINQTKTAKRFSVGQIDGRKLIAIGASTGGTEAIKSVLMGLPDKIPPILVAQHIPPLFSNAFAQRLDEMLPFKVKEAKHGELVQPNTVYVAPGGNHMRVKKTSSETRIEVIDASSIKKTHMPSVDILFESIARQCPKHSAAVLLTGMGRDGAEGLLALRQNGAVTIAQNEKTCVVYGMPKAAVEMGGAELVLPLDGIAAQLVDWLVKSDKSSKTNKAS